MCTREVEKMVTAVLFELACTVRTVSVLVTHTNTHKFALKKRGKAESSWHMHTVTAEILSPRDIYLL